MKVTIDIPDDIIDLAMALNAETGTLSNFPYFIEKLVVDNIIDIDEMLHRAWSDERHEYIRVSCGRPNCKELISPNKAKGE